MAFIDALIEIRPTLGWFGKAVYYWFATVLVIVALGVMINILYKTYCLIRQGFRNLNALFVKALSSGSHLSWW